MKKAIYTVLIFILAIFIATILILPKKIILIDKNLKKLLTVPIFTNVCLNDVKLSENSDRQFCAKKPIFKTEKELEIDLALMKGFYFEKGAIKRIFNILSKAPQGKWYQTPTGFFSAGVKKENHLSSLFPVYMPYSIQYTEDFFIHSVPVYVSTGKKVPQSFTGGCIRIGDEDAKFLFDNIKTGDRIVVYETLNNLKIKTNYSAPVDFEKVWVRQDFNNPLRIFYGIAKNADDKKQEYYHHAGIDLSGRDFGTLDVFSIADGKIFKIQKNDGTDHGFGNTIIIQYEISQICANNNTRICANTEYDIFYALYGHLSSVNPEIMEGREVKKGQLLGKIGNSGYGCQNYWRVGEDGCDKITQPDNHLHFEIKTTPVLENPEGGEVCYNKKRGEYGLCYGYTPDNPEKYGYLNPIKFLTNEKEKNENSFFGAKNNE